eukprot:COSAG02_NODE_48090_length_336_cov_0.864979_1_plen_61_part_01
MNSIQLCTHTSGRERPVRSGQTENVKKTVKTTNQTEAPRTCDDGAAAACWALQQLGWAWGM